MRTPIPGGNCLPVLYERFDCIDLVSSNIRRSGVIIFNQTTNQKKNLYFFSQKIALYLSCIIHDIDHRGYNNAFMIKNKSPLSRLYSTSTMEWHHFKQGVFILEVMIIRLSLHFSIDSSTDVSNRFGWDLLG